MKRTLMLLALAVAVIFLTSYWGAKTDKLTYSYGFLAGMIVKSIINSFKEIKK